MGYNTLVTADVRFYFQPPIDAPLGIFALQQPDLYQSTDFLLSTQYMQVMGHASSHLHLSIAWPSEATKSMRLNIWATGR